jgi:hypothetical protein
VFRIADQFRIYRIPKLSFRHLAHLLALMPFDGGGEVVAELAGLVHIHPVSTEAMIDPYRAAIRAG